MVQGRELGGMHGRVAVVTGASAGVGRATALLFGRLGADVALIARDAAALEETRAAIQSTGGRALALPLDVAVPEGVFAAAARVERELGPIDVWVNDAMVTVFSKVEDLTPEEVRRVTEVTYLGAVHGTMAALKHMRPRDAGVIVQVGSALAYRGIPLQAPYCGAKHALRGFTDSLRTELRHDGSRIAVTSVHLPAINTPQFSWARTHRERQPRPVAPVYAPEAAARAVARAAMRPVREYWVGGRTPLMILANAVVPQLLDRILARQAVGGQDRGEPVGPDRRDNLFEPVRGLHGTAGAFGPESRPRAAVIAGPAARLGAVAAAGLLGLALVGAGVAVAGRRGPDRRQLGR